VQLTRQVLLGEQRLAGPAGDYPGALLGEFLRAGDKHDVLARYPFGRLEHHWVPQAVGRMTAGPDPRRGDAFDARLGQPAAHEGLVLGAHRRPPVLAWQAEVRCREGGLGLQVVGVGDDRVRGGQLGDRADQLAGVPHVAAEEPGRRPVAGLPGVSAGV
jgi:hypothetical protein